MIADENINLYLTVPWRFSVTLVWMTIGFILIMGVIFILSDHGVHTSAGIALEHYIIRAVILEKGRHPDYTQPAQSVGEYR